MQEKVTPLKNAYKGKFLIGTALNYPALQGKAPLHVAIAATHFDALTAGNSMKPHDAASWLNNFPVRGRTDYALLFDRQGKPKPAFFAVLKAASPGAIADARPNTPRTDRSDRHRV